MDAGTDLPGLVGEDQLFQSGILRDRDPLDQVFLFQGVQQAADGGAPQLKALFHVLLEGLLVRTEIEKSNGGQLRDGHTLGQGAVRDVAGQPVELVDNGHKGKDQAGFSFFVVHALTSKC